MVSGNATIKWLITRQSHISQSYAARSYQYALQAPLPKTLASATEVLGAPDIVILDISEIIHMGNAHNSADYNCSTKLESISKQLCHECALCSLE